MGGGRPQFYIVDGEIKGVDMQTVKLLSKKMGFQYNIMNDPAMTGEQAIEMVREYIIHTKARVMYSTIQAYNGSCDIGFTTASQTHRRCNLMSLSDYNFWSSNLLIKYLHHDYVSVTNYNCIVGL